MLPPINRVKESDRNERTNPQLNCTLSAGLSAILQEHSRKTGEPVSHIVSRALAEYFQVSDSTLYQVSTATALVEGIYQGAVRVRTLREHGDLGSGTFENLDGEMMIVEGTRNRDRSFFYDGASNHAGSQPRLVHSTTRLCTTASKRVDLSLSDTSRALSFCLIVGTRDGSRSLPSQIKHLGCHANQKHGQERALSTL